MEVLLFCSRMFSEEHYSILIVKDASRILFCKKWMIIGYFADIIGEKNLIQANDILCKQLLAEKNYFTAASIIEAMGKLGISENITFINH